MKKTSVLVDCGTSYTKMQYVDSGRRRVVPTREILGKLSQYEVLTTTGHNNIPRAGKYVNELVALAEGGLSLIDEENFTLLDCGARDVKYVKVKNRRVAGMDWNTECGAFTGQVLELLIRYFNIDAERLSSSGEKVPVVCGVLGMTYMFDLISQGESHENAFARFLRGVAFNCETLVGRPDTIYLSGGLCENPAFISSFSCEAIPLGRYVLLEGLRKLTGG